MRCSSCGNLLDLDTIFCPECGAKYSESEKNDEDVTQVLNQADDDVTVILTSEVAVENNGMGNAAICPHCGASNTKDDFFCGTCGKSMQGETKEIVEVKASNGFQKKQIKNIFSNMKFPWKMIVMALCVVAMVVLLIIFLPSGEKEQIFYAKDNELWFVNVKNQETTMIGDRLEEAYEKENGTQMYGWSPYIQYSPDGKYVFYPQDIEYGSFVLYYTEANGKRNDAIKLDSEVFYYEITEDNQVIYFKETTLENGDDGCAVYIHNLKEKEKIAMDIESTGGVRITADKSKILFVNSERKLYICELNKQAEKVKIDSDIEEIIGVSKDFKKIIYKKSGSLYLYKDMKDREKLISDVDYAHVYNMDGKFKIVYSKSEDESISLMKFVEDDMKKDDELITAPIKKDYQKQVVTQGFWGESTSVQTSDAYYEDYVKYEEKLERDSIREELNNVEIQLRNGEVSIYEEESGEVQKIAEGYVQNFGGSYWGNVSEVESYVEIAVLEESNISKWKFSDILSGEVNIEVAQREKIEEALTYYIVTNEHVAEIAAEGYRSLSVSGFDYKNQLMYISKRNAEGKEDLFSISMKQESAGNMEEVAENIRNAFCAPQSGTLYYFKDVNEKQMGDLCSLADTIDYDVNINDVFVDPETQHVYYRTDVEDEGWGNGSLKIYDGKEKSKIADDVYDFIVLKNNKVAFLADYHLEKYIGDLKLFDRKEVKLIDTDVHYIFEINY